MPPSIHSEASLQLRFRIRLGTDIALGPGKADLLEQIALTGSISEAAKRLQMSYMRAWTLVQTMNRCFSEPVVLMNRGGSSHGGAQLSASGTRILELYRSMETQSREAIRQPWAELQSFLLPSLPE